MSNIPALIDNEVKGEPVEVNGTPDIASDGSYTIDMEDFVGDLVKLAPSSGEDINIVDGTASSFTGRRKVLFEVTHPSDAPITISVGGTDISATGAVDQTERVLVFIDADGAFGYDYIGVRDGAEA